MSRYSQNGRLAAWPNGAHGLALFDAFSRAGALVFSCGHAVLPLLRLKSSHSAGSARTGSSSGTAQLRRPQAAFHPRILSGCGEGAGAERGCRSCDCAGPPSSCPTFCWSVRCPFWPVLRRKSWAQAALAGTNAAVVEILASALLHPVWSSAIEAPSDVAIAAAGFVALSFVKAPAWSEVVGASGAPILQALV